mgnify:FL=1
MKYFLLPLIFFLTSCSLNKNSSYWNENSTKKSSENNKSYKVLNKTGYFKQMTFDEFNLFLKNYSDENDYPDINN